MSILIIFGAAACIGFADQPKQRGEDQKSQLIELCLVAARSCWETEGRAFLDLHDGSLYLACRWSVRLMDAEIYGSRGPTERLRAAQAHLDRIKAIHKEVMDRVAAAPGRHAG